jgi:sarcosine oxidase subunit gamma
VTAFATTRWSARNRMRVPAAMGESGPAMPVWLRDVSHSWRFGFKGAGAPGWCAAQGLPLPAQPNTYALLDGGGLVARLAHTEFYVEHEEEQRIGGLREALGRGVQAAGGGVYPVHRCDAGILLGGPLARDVLLQTCNVNFAAIDMAAAPVIMTLIVGVAVTVLPMQEGGQVVYRMACDPTFAPCLWTTLAGIAAESGGGPIATAT